MTIYDEVEERMIDDHAGSLVRFLAVAGSFGLLCLIALSYGIRCFSLLDWVKPWWDRRRHNRVLIVVEQPFEATAMRAATAGQRSGRLRGWRRRQGTEYLATYSRARLYLTIAGPGDTVQDAARCLSRTRPDLVILAGVCRGLHPERQSVGDIVLGSVLAPVKMDSAGPQAGVLTLDPAVEEAYYLLLARLRVQGPIRFEGFILCHGDLPRSWTLAEDLAGLDPRAVAASSERSLVYATAARLDPRCTGWAAVAGVGWYGQHRTTGNDHIAATSVAELIVTTARSTALNYR